MTEQQFNDWYLLFRRNSGTFACTKLDESVELKLAISQGQYLDAEAIAFRIVYGESREENRLNKLMGALIDSSPVETVKRSTRQSRS